VIWNYVSTVIRRLRSLSFSWLFKVTGYTLITLRRLDCTDQGIFGHLEWDKFDCVTLERHDIPIPAGTYKVSLYDSPRLGRKVPLLHGVPNRDMIEIHPGNYEHDSLGCILVGENRNGFVIEHSKDTFAQMMALWPVGEVEIKII
jgi:hypothetical protein